MKDKKSHITFLGKTNFISFRVTQKFILWFLIISFVPLTVAVYVSYNFFRKALRQEVTNSLSAIADNKANQINAYMEKQKKDGDTLSSMPNVIEAAEKFISAFHNGGVGAEEYNDVEKEFRPMVSYYQRLFGYENILIIDPDGNIVFSNQGKKEERSLYEVALNKHSELANVFIKTKESQEIETSNFEYDPDIKRAVFFIAMPIFKASVLTGVVAVSNQGLYGFAQDYAGLRTTGEIIIASKIGDEAVFITPIRFDSAAAFQRRIKFGSPEELYVQKSLSGENGSGIALDYRKNNVLAVWRYIPTFKLGISVKMDTQEVFTSADELKNTLFKVGFLLLAIVIVVAIVVARSISGPIKDLTHASKTITGGNFSARARISTQDEIGELAHFFNQMTDSLVEAKVSVEQKNTEVEEQKKLLEEANRELDSFVYTVSHDLRAPLRGIDGLADFLERDYAKKMDEQGIDYLKKIRYSAKHMKLLIDDLLTLSRISRIKNPYEDTDMGELIKSVINRLEFDIKKYNVEFKMPGDIPIVRCDRIKIAEVFFNLISNAIKFSSKNKDVNPKVEIGYNNREDIHEFYVKDNGIGIDKQYHKEIFGIFKRLHKASEYEGTGAGLGIVKKIVDDHGGSIWIESEPGKGAAFYFTIPKRLKEETKKEEPQ